MLSDALSQTKKKGFPHPLENISNAAQVSFAGLQNVSGQRFVPPVGVTPFIVGVNISIYIFKWVPHLHILV